MKVTQKQFDQAWEFVRRMREEWTVEDWADFYHGISFALYRIAKRHQRKPQPPVIDFQI